MRLGIHPRKIGVLKVPSRGRIRTHEIVLREILGPYQRYFQIPQSNSGAGHVDNCRRIAL